MTRLRCEHLSDPLGLDTTSPRLSWQVRSSRRGTTQRAYQVLVSSSAALLAQSIGDLWDSGRVESEDSVLVPYDGVPLSSRQRAHWSVRVWDDTGSAASSSEPAWWEMGLLHRQDWSAQWVAAPRAQGHDAEGRVSYLRGSLLLPSHATRVRAYASALGIYELHCNGERVGNARFTPGWTDYAQRLHYQVYNLDGLLHPGENVIGAVLAEGWYAGHIGFLGHREHYGSTPQLLVQVEVQTEDGLVVHTTDSSWTAGGGPIRSSDMLLGEHVDARLDDPTWCRPGSVPSAWARVQATGGTPARRSVSPAPPVRVLQEREPMSVKRIGPEAHRIDVGQNIVGWLRLRLTAERGSTATVRHAEVLEEDGTLHTANLRTASSTDTYVSDGCGPRTFEPRFTFHGFRYAEVTGYAPDLSTKDVTAVVCGSDLERVGHFSCSDARVSQLHENIVWGARGNFFEIPTDCPQRDERLGWTGDAQVFAPTATYLFDMAGFLTKWLRDMCDTQTSAGSFADVAPRVVLGPEGSAGWADAGVLVPWQVFRTTGDRRVLAETYPAMRAWLRYVHGANPGLLWREARGYDNGDWLAPSAETDKELIATAFFAHSALTTGRVAQVLGLDDDARELAELAQAIRARFCEAYLLNDGRLTCETQTAYALALRFELLPADVRPLAERHLIDDVERRGHLTTGFLGVAHLLPALTAAGRVDLAYRLLLKDDPPSWLHSVRAGATTIWERWDGWTAEAGLYDPGMNSFNHYAFGAVGEWLYSTVAGIRQEEPQGRRLLIAPHPARGIDSAQASHLTPKGPTACSWQLRDDDRLDVRVEVPVGATAGIRLPVDSAAAVTESGAPVALASNVQVVQRNHEAIWLNVGSGLYSFSVATTTFNDRK